MTIRIHSRPEDVLWEYVSKSRPDSLIESRSSVAIDWEDGDHKESDQPPNLPDADEHAPGSATV
ncbi:MAG: hypothetical protein ACLP5E_19650 [Streptosporangiaceae bacterium]